MNQRTTSDWEQARVVLGDSNLPEEVGALDRGQRREIAETLIGSGWSYRQMSQALDVPTTTLHRWLSPRYVSDAEARSGVGLALGVIAGALVSLIVRKGWPRR
jgi:hypothetical protein